MQTTSNRILAGQFIITYIKPQLCQFSGGSDHFSHPNPPSEKWPDPPEILYVCLVQVVTMNCPAKIRLEVVCTFLDFLARASAIFLSESVGHTD